jgi:hypothetical protein
MEPVVYLFLAFCAVVIIIGFSRWVFRIDEIVAILRRIESNTASQLPKYLKPDMCESCGKLSQPHDLYTLDSGQRICARCLAEVKPPKTEKKNLNISRYFV